jgi:hypothetical protein
VLPAAVLEQQKNLMERESCLEEERAALKKDLSLRSVETLKRMEEERDQELERFLDEVQHFVGGGTNAIKRQKSLKGQQHQKKEAEEVKSGKGLELTGTVSSIRTLLERQTNDVQADDDSQQSEKPKVGKVKTDFLTSKLQESILRILISAENFSAKFYPQILYTFPSKNNSYKFI